MSPTLQEFNTPMQTLFPSTVLAMLRDAARGSLVVGRKAIKVGRATIEIVVRVIFDRAK